MKFSAKNSVHSKSIIQKNLLERFFGGSKNIVFKTVLLVFGLVSMLGSTIAATFLRTGFTPANNAWIVANSFTAQLDITESSLTQFSRSRNGTTYPIYDSGLVLMMNFDKVSALGETDGLIKDFSQYGNNGSGYGGITWTGDGKWNGGYIFDGNDSIGIPGSSGLYFGTSVTISVRFYRIGTINNQTFASSNHYYGNGYNGNWLFRVTTDSSIGFASYDGQTNESWKEFAFIINNNTRNHAVISINGITATCYLNGIASSSGPLNHTKALIDAGVSGLHIGDDIAWSNVPFQGKIDEVRIYNRALTSGEISVLYNSNLNKYNTNKWNFTILQTGMVPDYSYSYSGIVNNIGTGRTIGRDNIGPTTPILLSPTSGTTTDIGNINFIRSGAIDTGAGISGYAYQISTTSGFTTFTTSGTTTTTGISLTGFTEGTYYRRVSAYDTMGNTGSRSDIRNFSVDFPMTFLRTGSTPANNAWINSSSFTAQLDITESSLTQFSRSQNGTTYPVYDSGLVLMMNFDKVSALGETDGLIKDFSQYGNNGSGYGGVVWTGDGKWNGGYSFNGIDDRIENKMTIGPSMTRAFWIKSNNYNQTMPISMVSNNSLYGPTLYFYQNKISWNVGDGDANPFVDSGVYVSYPNQEWHHIIVINNSITNSTTLYIDGIYKGNANYINSTATTKSFVIGRWAYSNAVEFNGLIDEVRIYNRAITSGEISTLYNSNLNKYDTNKWSFTILQTGITSGIYGYTGTASDSLSTISTGRSIQQDNIGPTTPILLSPTSGTMTDIGNINFIRSGAIDTGAGIGGYIYQISTTSGFTTFTTSGTTTTTGISLTGFTEGTYYRRVAAYDTMGNTGPRSDIRNFSIDFPTTFLRTGSTPADNAWINSSSFTAQLDITELFLTQFSRSQNGTTYPIYDSGLVLMMNFDKVSALGETDGLIKDFSLLGVNGSGYLGVTWTENGKWNGGYSFDGNNDYIQSNDTNNLNLSNQITVSAWIKTDLPYQGTKGLVSRSNNGSTPYGFDLNLESDGRIRFRVASNSTTIDTLVYSNGVVQAGVWTHVVGIVSGTSSIIYLNGLPGNNYVRSSTIYTGILKTDIGRRAQAGRYFNGSIDEVRIYNRALTSGEISTLYNSNFNKYDTNKWNFAILQTGMVPDYSYSYTGIASDSLSTTSISRTISYVAPSPAPILLSPVSGDISNATSRDFVRNPSTDSNLSGYIYQISTTLGFSTFTTSGTTTTTGISLTGFTEGLYYRRVAAYDTMGNTGSRSDIRNFSVDLPATFLRTGSTPANNAWIATNSFTAQLDITESFLTQFSRSRVGIDYPIYDSGLILMMNFDKVSALGETDTLIKDFSSYGNNGSEYGGVTWTGNGKWNGGYKFNGSTSYIDIGSDNIFNFGTSNFTTSLRFKTANKVETNGSYATPIAFGSYYGASGWKIAIKNTDGKLESRWGGSAQTTSISGNLDDNQWHHVVYTRSGNIFVFYIDGQSNGTSNSSASLGLTKLVIGVGGTTPVTNGGFWNGSIDEVRIYNRALTSGEISVLYNSNLNKYNTNKWNFTVLATGITSGIYGYTGTASDLLSTTSTGRSIQQDNVGPNFTFANNSGPECSAGSLTITSAVDAGVGVHDTSPYSFNGVAWNLTASTSIVAQQAGTQVRTGRVRDQLENFTTHTATYTFGDVAPTADDFTGHATVGNISRTVNWKTLSNAAEGSCSTDDIIYDSIVSQGSKGTCSVVGNNITYTPNTGQVGSDACTLRIKDNENTTTDIVVSRGNIDTSGPSSPVLLSPANGSSSTTGSVNLFRSGSIDVGVGLSGYVWQLSTGSNFAVLVTGGFTTTTGVFISGLSTTTYYRRVYAVDTLNNSGSRSTSRSFIIAPAISFVIESPSALALGNIPVPEVTQIVEKVFTGTENYFTIADYLGNDDGYYTTLSMSNMTDEHGNILSNNNIAIKSASSIVTLAGSENPNVTSAIGGSYVTFGNDVLTFIKRDTGPNDGVTGTYGVSPALKLTIPELQNIGNYSGTLIYTIYPN